MLFKKVRIPKKYRKTAKYVARALGLKKLVKDLHGKKCGGRR